MLIMVVVIIFMVALFQIRRWLWPSSLTGTIRNSGLCRVKLTMGCWHDLVIGVLFPPCHETKSLLW